jgi:hypothetical protein
MNSKFEQFEKEFDDLIDDTPLDFMGIGSSADGDLKYKEFTNKVEKLKALVRNLLEDE